MKNEEIILPQSLGIETVGFSVVGLEKAGSEFRVSINPDINSPLVKNLKVKFGDEKNARGFFKEAIKILRGLGGKHPSSDTFSDLITKYGGNLL